MPRPIPPPLSLALTVLRSSKGWSQKELSQAAGLPRGMISDYEMGRRPLSPRKLEAFAALLGIDAEEMEVALLPTRSLRPAGEALGPPLGPTAEQQEGIERTVARVIRRSADVAREELTRSLRETGIQRDREGAEAFWQRLKTYPPEEQRFLVQNGRSLSTWALCEKLCAESERAAAADAARALELADLALADRGAGRRPEGWRSRLQGYAWAFVGNARRVANDLPAAEQAFSHAWELWNLAPSREQGPLAEWRLLDLEASLRRGQRRLSAGLGPPRPGADEEPGW